MPAGTHGKGLTQAAVRLAVASLLLSPGELLAQCAICWQTLANSAEGASLIRGFHDGILFLLVVPFSVVAIIGFLLYKAQRSKSSGALVTTMGSRPPEPGLATPSKSFAGVLAPHGADSRLAPEPCTTSGRKSGKIACSGC